MCQSTYSYEQKLEVILDVIEKGLSVYIAASLFDSAIEWQKSLKDNNIK